MQQPQPLAPNRKLIVLDVDDTLISVDSVGQTNPPRQAFFPQSVKRILEIAKSNPDVYVVIASKVSTTEEINSALNNISNIDHPHIRVFGKLDIRNIQKYPNGKLSAVESVTKEWNIKSQDVIWVDDSLPDVEEAAKQGYVPVLVPCSEVGAQRTLQIASSSYLDCLPALIVMKDKRGFVGKLSNLNISDKNRYTPDIARQLASIYQTTADQYEEMAKEYVSSPGEVIKKGTISHEELNKRATDTIEYILQEFEKLSTNCTSEERIEFLSSLENPIMTTFRYMDEKTKTKISRYLEAKQFTDDKNPKLQRLLVNINRVLDMPARVIGHMSPELVSQVVKPHTGSDPLTRINFNQSFIYRRETGKPFSTFDSKIGQNNLTREFAAANPANQTHSGFKIQGNHISQEDFDIKSGNEEYRQFITTKYLPLISPDRELQEWAKYNAHMSGPVAECVQNLQVIFKNLADQSFIMDMEGSSFNVYTMPQDKDAVYFTARIPFLQALEESKGDIKRHEGEETRYPAHQHKGVRDPVAVYEITIKGLKSEEGVVSQLVAENFACYHSHLLPAFNKVDKLIEQRRRFDHVRDGIIVDINNFVAETKSKSKQQGFFSTLFPSNEGAEIISHIREKIQELTDKIKKDPMSLDYEVLSKDLLNFVIEEKQKYLAHPTSEVGKKFRDVLDNIVDNFSSDFKEVLPQPVARDVPRAPSH